MAVYTGTESLHRYGGITPICQRQGEGIITILSSQRLIEILILGGGHSPKLSPHNLKIDFLKKKFQKNLPFYLIIQKLYVSLHRN
jgi:hypothetical protein